jgi:hypothetical protein
VPPPNGSDRGPYEHLTPNQWPGPDKTMPGGYHHCCISNCWGGQAPAVRLMKAEKLYDHDILLAYEAHWMHEDDAEFLPEIA